jgi:RNA polymerase sigma-70 factor (ECF subfamily)
VKIEDPSSDQALMAAFVARDERAAGALYDRFASRVYGLGIVMLGNDHAAQDLVQDTFVKLWRTAARFDPERGRLETWILLTARSARDRPAAPPGARVALPAGARPAAGPRPAPGPDDLAATADLASARAPRDDQAQQRAAVRARARLFRRPHDRRGRGARRHPAGTAKTRIHAALLKLRAEMAKEADDDV